MIGRSKAWSRTALGCVVRFRLAVDGREHYTAVARAERDAMVAAEHVRAAVLTAEPHAEVLVRSPGVGRGAEIHVRVHADAIAALDGGPAHRKAMACAMLAATKAHDQEPWLESEKPTKQGETT